MLQSRRVLVVDDDAVVGHSINRVLTEQGYQVREMLSGAAALEELKQKRYDMVFADIRMPDIDGLEMAALIKVNHPNLPVLVITGYGTEANERKAHDLGVSGFLRKPLTPEMIVDNADRVLRERSETMEAIRKSALGMLYPAAAVAPQAVAVSGEVRVGEDSVNVARNVALFFAAPFIGLAYILVFPFVGLWAIGKYGYKAIAAKR